MNVNYPSSARPGAAARRQTGTRGDKMRISGQHSANTAQNATYRAWRGEEFSVWILMLESLTLSAPHCSLGDLDSKYWHLLCLCGAVWAISRTQEIK